MDLTCETHGYQHFTGQKNGSVQLKGPGPSVDWLKGKSHRKLDSLAWFFRPILQRLAKTMQIYLIGGIPTPLKNMKVRLDHHPNY